LQLSGVKAAGFKPHTQALEGVPGRNLCAPASVAELRRIERRPPQLEPLLLEPRQASTVDRLEREAALKPLLRGGIERGGRLKRPPAQRLFAVTGKTKGPPGRPSRGAQTADAAEPRRATAFQLSAWERNPLSFNYFSGCVDRRRRHHGLLAPVYEEVVTGQVTPTALTRGAGLASANGLNARDLI
jgi:hypothetical protein